MEATISHAENPADIRRCYAVMSQLRPHLDEDGFIERVERQRRQGYRLAFLESEGRVHAVAGYRLSENLAWGRFCYVDDLVTHDGERSRGFGKQLFDWLVALAKEAGCEQFHLDSGVQRFAAHRFYLARRMEITSHHFGMRLTP